MLKMAIILLLAAFLRLTGINWDQGAHLHPDERMLIMVTDRINFFNNLNPDFFNYGSLPIYLLRLVSPNGNYDSLLIVGRLLSISFDLLTVILIYKITKLLFNKEKVAYLASFLYTIAFFPIQNSHFFVVDVFLTTFTTLTFYLLLTYLKSPNFKNIILVAISFASMLATKFTAIVFLPIIVGVIILKNLKDLKFLFKSIIIFFTTLLIFHFFFMPYAYIKHQKFISDISLQLKMNSDPYIFPYTLQYVGTLPYFYYLKNIILWGLGPFISVLAFIGIIFSKKPIDKKNKIYFLLFFSFYFIYFLVVGRSSVKFMRYMLPIYPFLISLAGFGLYQLKNIKKLKILAYLGIGGAIIYSLMFNSIYSKPHTRIAATEWILKNINSGSTLAVEHWDDRIPTYQGEKYNYEELGLYELPDDGNKWKMLSEKLNKSDYIIIASNRLYTPLQKLSDCKKYRSCYPKTAEYYKKLFNNELNFKLIKEFSAPPLFIDDQSSDESFTVYDHPKIFIFKKK